MLVEGLNVRITEGLSKLEEVVIQLSEKEIETNKDFTYTVDLVKPFTLPWKARNDIPPLVIPATKHATTIA